MAKKLTADEIAAAVHDLAQGERDRAVKDILIDLEASLAQGMCSEDTDTFECGLRAAIETIRQNY